jgi:hypothetical protein
VVVVGVGVEVHEVPELGVVHLAAEFESASFDLEVVA